MLRTEMQAIFKLNRFPNEMIKKRKKRIEEWNWKIESVMVWCLTLCQMENSLIMCLISLFCIFFVIQKARKHISTTCIILFCSLFVSYEPVNGDRLTAIIQVNWKT